MKIFVHGLSKSMLEFKIKICLFYLLLLRKLLIEKRYIISNMAASTSDMTMTSTIPPHSDQLYDNVGPPRRNSELAEIGEETMMWRGNESPYVYDLGENETLSELTNEVYS